MSAVSKVTGRDVQSDLPKRLDYLLLVDTDYSARRGYGELRLGSSERELPMTTDTPLVNQSDFVATYKNSVVAIIPNGRLVESSAALAKVGVDLTRVDVLQGEIGAQILDFDGVEHGFWAHVVRTLQKLGTASNERENFAWALRNGESIIIIPVHSHVSADVSARILEEHGGRRIIHIGKHAAEQLSY
jgi:hypothetical protein